MTCIAAVCDGARVAMAADSLAVDTNGTFMEVAKLLAFDGGALIGVAGSSAAIPLLRRRLTPGAPVDDLDEWAQDVAWQASELLLEANIVDPGDVNDFYGVLLLAHGAAMWEIQTGVANRVRRGYHAIGSGDEVAFGALWALGGDLRPEHRARRAVEAAAAHMVDVGGQIDTATT